MARQAADALVNLSGAAKLTKMHPDEVRFICQYEGVTVFGDGRTRARYLRAADLPALREAARQLRKGRAAYNRARVHPAFQGEGT